MTMGVERPIPPQITIIYKIMELTIPLWLIILCMLPVTGLWLYVGYLYWKKKKNEGRKI
jgi:hypothetical protein